MTEERNNLRKRLKIACRVSPPLLLMLKIYKALSGASKLVGTKENAIRGHAVDYGIDVFVETGTYLGDMVHTMKRVFREIYSIELDKELYDAATRRFRNDGHIHLVYGDSARLLPECLKKVDRPAVFWLDAHFSGEDTAMPSEEKAPIFEELSAIFDHPVKDHVILIDDADSFIGQGQYPAMERLRKFVKDKGVYSIFEVRDGLVRIRNQKRV